MDPLKSNSRADGLKKNSETAKNKSESRGSSGFADIRSLVFALLFGIVFGFLMNKANVFVAPTIRMQMLFQRYAMLKMFLAAVGVSMLSISILVLCCESVYRKALNTHIQQNNRRDVWALLGGGILIGLGMVVCGSCPGTVFVQVGSGVTNSLFTCLGALLAVYVYYGLVNDYLTRLELPSSALVLRQMPDLFGVNRVVLNLILGIVFLSIAIILEFLIPWQSDIGMPVHSSYDNIFNMEAWSPAWCGAGVGLLQLFFIFFLEKSLGISTAFTVIAAQICRIQAIGRAIPTLSSFAYGVKHGVVLLFALGAIFGSFLSTSLADRFPLGPEHGANIFCSILGGFLLVLGARCAGGCTSGQGISGVSHLFVGSFIATAGMFGGGILFAIGYGMITSDWHFDAL